LCLASNREEADLIVRRYTDPIAYRDRVSAYLEREEAVNNLPLGIVYRLAAASQHAGTSARAGARQPLLALVEEQGRVIFVMVMTPPHNLIVCGTANTVGVAVSFLLHEGISPPGVIGPRDVATRFASAWCARTGCTPSVRTEQMIYRLDRVNPIAYSPGMLIRAEEAHLDLLTEWMIGFFAITPEGALETEEARARAEEAVGGGRVYLWHDAAPVSMAWKTRPTRHGITVSGVYTPPELRRRGYATSCVAALSQLLLDEGHAYCTLYTDLANPISNHIYQEIGYHPIRASIDLVFGAPE
jgi:predicted GNAT family acetyltransferase